MNQIPKDGICHKHLIMGCSMCSTHTDKSLEDKIEEILDNLGCPRKSPSTRQAKQSLTQLIKEQVVEALNKAHRAGGTADFDNATDEYIDEMVDKLQAQKGHTQ